MTNLTPEEQQQEKRQAQFQQAQSEAVDLIIVERNKQLETYSYEHDAQWINGELPMAAYCYLMLTFNLSHEDALRIWPWNAEMFKPSDSHKDNLIKSGALYEAEISRLDYSDLEDEGNTVRDLHKYVRDRLADLLLVER